MYDDNDKSRNTSFFLPLILSHVHTQIHRTVKEICVKHCQMKKKNNVKIKIKIEKYTKIATRE